MQVGDLVQRIYEGRLGIVIRDVGQRCIVVFFDENSPYDMDKRLLEVLSESR